LLKCYPLTGFPVKKFEIIKPGPPALVQIVSESTFLGLGWKEQTFLTPF